MPGVPESGFPEQQASRGFFFWGGGRVRALPEAGERGDPGHGFSGAGIPLSGSPGAGAESGAPLTRLPGCS